MTPAELERELARLVRLAESARHTLDELGGAIRELEKTINEAEPKNGSNRTTDAEMAQEKVASK